MDPTSSQAPAPSTVPAINRRGVTPELAAAVDFGRTSDDYARFRPGPPASFYTRLEAMIPLKGLAAADVGAGTGVVSIELAKRGAVVTAIDPAQPQLDHAARLAKLAGVSLQTRCAKAESTGLAPHSLDLVVASQAWHWFDPVKAGAEAMRTLRPGGHILTVSFDYLSGRSTLAARTEQLILKYNPTWPLADGNGCHIRPLYDLPAAGFIGLEQFSYEHEQLFTHEGWRGRMRTCNGIGASLSSDKVQGYDAELAELLAGSTRGSESRETEGRHGVPDHQRGHGVPDHQNALLTQTQSHGFPNPVGVVHRVWVVVARKPEP